MKKNVIRVIDARNELSGMLMGPREELCLMDVIRVKSMNPTVGLSASLCIFV